jgi:hypothetical protein
MNLAIARTPHTDPASGKDSLPLPRYGDVHPALTEVRGTTILGTLQPDIAAERTPPNAPRRPYPERVNFTRQSIASFYQHKP